MGYRIDTLLTPVPLVGARNPVLDRVRVPAPAAGPAASCSVPGRRLRESVQNPQQRRGGYETRLLSSNLEAEVERSAVCLQVVAGPRFELPTREHPGDSREGGCRVVFQSPSDRSG